jgi:hypothetical protein
MRGEGAPADVRCSTAAFRDWRSCTSLFHHGDAERMTISSQEVGGDAEFELLQAPNQLLVSTLGQGRKQ